MFDAQLEDLQGVRASRRLEATRLDIARLEQRLTELGALGQPTQDCRRALERLRQEWAMLRAVQALHPNALHSA